MIVQPAYWLLHDCATCLLVAAWLCNLIQLHDCKATTAQHFTGCLEYLLTLSSARRASWPIRNSLKAGRQSGAHTQGDPKHTQPTHTVRMNLEWETETNNTASPLATQSLCLNNQTHTLFLLTTHTFYNHMVHIQPLPVPFKVQPLHFLTL